MVYNKYKWIYLREVMNINNLKYIKPSQYAKIVGLHYRTIIRKFHEGKIEGYHDGKTILLLNPLYNNENNSDNGKTRAVLYSRVSSSTNKPSLDGQIKRMRTFASAKGYTVVKEVKEIASGLNDERPKLQKIISSNDWDVLIVEHKDRLTRFGFNYFNSMLNKSNQRVEVINECIDKSKNQELTEDLIAIITFFAEDFMGLTEKKKLIRL